MSVILGLTILLVFKSQFDGHSFFLGRQCGVVVRASAF